jgi:FkbM family methyltransferase
MKVFDVGANAGFYTLAFSRLVGPGGHVWAFEPLEFNLRNLRQHVALNALSNVTIVPAAVAERSGIARFDAGANNSVGHLAAGGNLEVQTISLDQFCAEAEIDCPDMIKFDIEGGEGAAFDGARGVLGQCRTAILLALHGADKERKCLALLRATGYQLQYLDGSQVRDGPLQSDEIVAIPRTSASSTCAA